MNMRTVLLIGAFGLAACTQFPELDAAVSADADTAPPPELVPVEQILARAALDDPSADEDTEAALEARAAALRARADRLRKQ